MINMTKLFKKKKKINLKLTNVCAIQNEMSTEAARMYLHSMILSHFNYCLTSWSPAGQSAKKTLEVLYKQAIKVMTKKTQALLSLCNLKNIYSLSNWDSLHTFADLNLIYKVLHNLAPDPLAEFIGQRNSSEHVTPGSVRGGCSIPLHRSTLSKSAWSVRSASEWNSVPEEVKLLTIYKAFKKIKGKCGLSTPTAANTKRQARCHVLMLGYVDMICCDVLFNITLTLIVQSKCLYVFCMI